MNDIADTAPPETGAAPTDRPVIRVSPGRQKRVRAGHPWVFSNEIEMTPEAKALPRGTVVDVVDAAGSAIGTAIFNPNTLISARLLTSHSFADIDADWLAAKIVRAAALRDRLYDRRGPDQYRRDGTAGRRHRRRPAAGNRADRNRAAAGQRRTAS